VALILLLALSLSLPARAQDSALRTAARLDSEKKCGEAERIYQQVLAQGTPSLALLNNLGNHYVVCDDSDKAQSYFERILKLSPQHVNANLQLARIAADRHQGTRALEHLSRVNNSQPATRMLRAEAMHWSGKNAAALTMLDGLWKEIAQDPRLVFLQGLTYARIGAYDRAEAAFNAVLVQRPDDFDVLFNLGRAAARAKHYDRAQRALEVAVRLHPDSVDALVELGQVNAAVHDYTKAIYLLAKAKQLAPGRPEILLALARTAQGGAYYGDAAIAYDEYLQLRPADDAAQREHALVCGYTDSRKAEGLDKLAAYVRKHPNDPLGYYDLAQLTWRDHPQEALDQLTRAVRLDPEFPAARVNRAWLLNRLGRAAEAIPDLQKAIEIDPRDARALDQLGSIYSSLDRPADAKNVLRRALAISPEDPDVLLHIGRALMELGREEEAQQFLTRYQKARLQKVRGPWRQPGMIVSAMLPAAERTRREIERLRQDARTHPDDPELQLHLASLLLTDGRIEEASTEFRVLLSRNAENRIWEEAGKYLLHFEQYGLARQFLQRAAAGRPANNLDLAIAVFYMDGPAKALKTLEEAPDKEESGDYLLLKARILDAAGQGVEAEQVLERGLKLTISRPQIAQQAALLLVRHDRKELALDLLNKTAGTNPELLLTAAIVQALMDRTADAEKALKEIESQWPEWDRAYLVHGLMMERTRPREAIQKLRTAIALGSQDPSARCALARLASSTPPDTLCRCVGGLYELLFPTCAR
jgi:tetratricopeptide (TPR) repeat protein